MRTVPSRSAITIRSEACWTSAWSALVLLRHPAERERVLDPAAPLAGEHARAGRRAAARARRRRGSLPRPGRRAFRPGRAAHPRDRPSAMALSSGRIGVPSPTRRRTAIRTKSTATWAARAAAKTGAGPAGRPRQEADGEGAPIAYQASPAARRPRPAGAGRTARAERTDDVRARHDGAGRSRGQQHEHREEHELHRRRPALLDVELHRQHDDEQRAEHESASRETPDGAGRRPRSPQRRTRRRSRLVGARGLVR